MAGVTLTGFERKRLVDIQAAIEKRIEAFAGKNVDLSPERPLGQMIGIMSELIAEEWEGQEAIYNAYTMRAEGAALSNILETSGAPRIGARYSKVVITFTGTKDILVPAGTEVATPEGTAYITIEPKEIGALGTVDIVAYSKVPGPFNSAAGTITTLKTPIYGVDSITNKEYPYDIGRNRETDAEARARHYISLLAGGRNIADALYGQLIALKDVADAKVLENKTDLSVDGIPAHRFEAVVLGGDTVEIAATVWGNTIVGIQSFGTTEHTVIDGQDKPQKVYFTRSGSTQVYVKVVLSVNPLEFLPDGLDQIKKAIVEWGNTTHGIGDTVKYFQFYSVVNQFSGIIDADITIGLATNPTGTANIDIDERNHAAFDYANIEVTK